MMFAVMFVKLLVKRRGALAGIDRGCRHELSMDSWQMWGEVERTLSSAYRPDLQWRDFSTRSSERRSNMDIGRQ